MKKLKCWVPNSDESDFSIYNIPFGIFSNKKAGPRVGIAIGDKILDLNAVAKKGLFDKLKIDKKIFSQDTLNAFIALGKSKTNRVRTQIQKWLCSKTSPLLGSRTLFVSQRDAKMHMPITIGDYTDFYSSKDHATNIGTMFRDPKNALLPNWKHLPVGYHGRASSIIESGQSIRRPKGQVLPKGKKVPVFSPCRLLDFELEMGFVVGKSTKLGSSVSTEDAEDHIFGFVLFNDWSARDIQKWEYVPLGPFLGKSFASSISPWVVTLEALDYFRVRGEKQDPPVQPYLKYKGKRNLNINLEVSIKPQGSTEKIVSKSNYKHMYWNMTQQLAHHTVNGCNLNVGDVMASGTISGKKESSYGSMLELSWAGTKEIPMNDGTTRKFIKDYDTVIMRGYAQKNGFRVGFGEVSTKVLPAQ